MVLRMQESTAPTCHLSVSVVSAKRVHVSEGAPYQPVSISSGQGRRLQSSPLLIEAEIDWVTEF